MTSIRSYLFLLPVLSVAFAFAADIAVAYAAKNDRFHPNDSRVFKATACTKDHNQVEALYYIAASRLFMER